MQRYALNPILPNISVKNTSYLYTFNTLSPFEGLNLNNLTIVSQIYIFRQYAVSLTMQADIMPHMRKICMFSTYPSCKGNCVCNSLMGMMFGGKAQRIDNKRLYPAEIRKLALADCLHVCYVKQAAYSVSKNWHLVVHHLYRHNIKISNAQ